MDIPSISTAATSLHLAKQALDAMLGVKEFNSVAPQLADINRQLLDAQQGLFLHSAKMAELQEELLRAKAELGELRKKADERERYSLFQISGGGLVYRFKQVEGRADGIESDGQPPHYLCQPCLDVRNIKVVLQERAVDWHCAECKANFGNGKAYPVPASFTSDFF